MNGNLEAVRNAFEKVVLFGFREVEPGCLQIRTSFTYPDGDLIDVFVVDAHGLLRVTDMGETARYLEDYDVSIDHHAVQRIVRRSFIHLVRGELYQEVATMKNVPEAMLELIQCIERICGMLGARGWAF